MEIDYSGIGVTWSSFEKYHEYEKVMWRTDKSGIPRFKFIVKDNEF